MKTNKLVLLALALFATESAFAFTGVCTITDDDRKPVKVNRTASGNPAKPYVINKTGTGVNLTYNHKGNFISGCSCAKNTDIPPAIKLFCQKNKLNSNQPSVLKITKTVRGVMTRVGARVSEKQARQLAVEAAAAKGATKVEEEEQLAADIDAGVTDANDNTNAVPQADADAEAEAESFEEAV